MRFRFRERPVRSGSAIFDAEPMSVAEHAPTEIPAAAIDFPHWAPIVSDPEDLRLLKSTYAFLRDLRRSMVLYDEEWSGLGLLGTHMEELYEEIGERLYGEAGIARAEIERR